MRAFSHFVIFLTLFFISCKGTQGSRSQGSFMMAEEGEDESPSVDELMREAYQRWEFSCRKFNLPLTPAYDVVGLAAALRMHDLFNREEKLFEKGEEKFGLASHLTLKLNNWTEFSRIFSDDNLEGNSVYFPENILIITDHGEEVDDEVTLLLANKVQKLGVNVSVLFTTDHFEEERDKYLAWTHEQGMEPIRNIYSKESFVQEATRETLFEEGLVSILQIGPIHNNGDQETLELMVAFEEVLKDVPYDYYLLGLYGQTLNSQRDAEGPSAFFYAHSEEIGSEENPKKSTYVVDTLQGEGAFKFTFEALKVLFGRDHDILNHAIKIAWRNTVGRADTDVGRFIAHLIAEYEGGANYQTANLLVQALKRQHALPRHPIEAKDVHRAEALADEYIRRLKATIPPFRLIENPDGTTNARHGIAVEKIKSGYVYILTNLYSYFGVPIEFFESGKPEEWNKQWLYPSLKDREVAGAKEALFKITMPVELAGDVEEGGQGK